MKQKYPYIGGMWTKRDMFADLEHPDTKFRRVIVSICNYEIDKIVNSFKKIDVDYSKLYVMTDYKRYAKRPFLKRFHTILESHYYNELFIEARKGLDIKTRRI